MKKQHINCNTETIQLYSFETSDYSEKEIRCPNLPYISSYLNGVTFRKKWNRRSLLSVVVLGCVVSFAVVCGRLKLNHSQ